MGRGIRESPTPEFDFYDLLHGRDRQYSYSFGEGYLKPKPTPQLDKVTPKRGGVNGTTKFDQTKKGNVKNDKQNSQLRTTKGGVNK